ncbi:MAG: TetR/AcrR family transcriptional repressor of nem operon [Chlamydiales bacterium]|jgi:TetR/AcrR family transcriptional repressor of nem operon
MPPSTRQALIETAARLFHEQGFAATGVATILRESGLKSGSLYHCFENKEALLVGVLDWYEQHLWPVVLGPIEAAESDPIERIFALLAWYRAGVEQCGCRMGCPIGNLALEVSDTHPEVRPSIDVNFRNWAAGIEKWLREASNRLPDDCDMGALSRIILTVMEGGLMQVRAHDDLTPFDGSVNVLRDYMDRLLLKPPTTAPPKGSTR